MVEQWRVVKEGRGGTKKKLFLILFHIFVHVCQKRNILYV